MYTGGPVLKLSGTYTEEGQGEACMRLDLNVEDNGNVYGILREPPSENAGMEGKVIPSSGNSAQLLLGFEWHNEKMFEIVADISVQGFGEATITGDYIWAPTTSGCRPQASVRKGTVRLEKGA
eukprot:CAMPEP_0176108354 /NCGR_PEP_ID=MMETSP0120_2-20121206/54393_1 /TAXON_ID=160619 /ORGANISM="Kryptoperidinium foliaceum, Strain CCMP 1326" /LENGTH=122 /DNA_ID=CAMNT_0017442519 /DNA_START=125 /DNA_END=489 /DNA_ORIENTATION=+